MSKNTKTLLTILIIAIVFCVVGVAVAVGGLGLVANQFKDNMTTDKPKIQKMAQAFINYELPAAYTEQMGMDFIIFKMIMLGAESDSRFKPLIFLTGFQESSGSPEQISEQMQKSVERQGGQKGLKLKLVETRKVMINGKETSLDVSEGTNSAGEDYRQWLATFPGKTGFVILLIQGPIDEWDDAALNQFLASLGT